MDPHLDDPLNLDSAIGVDFGQAEEVVTDTDILVTGHHEGDINMSTDVEFEHIEEQSMLMETEGEEIIVPDLMSEQFMLADSSYSQDDQMTGIVTINSNNEQQNILLKPGAMNLQFVPQTSVSSVDFGQDIQVIQPQIITVQSNQQQINKKNSVQQLATIMPKPLTVNTQDILKQKTVLTPKSHSVAKPLAIAPKPMTLIKPNLTGTVMKKMSVSNFQTAPKPGSMIAQIGKQLVVLPPGSARKLKLLQNDESNQLQHLSSDETLTKTKSIPVQKAFLTKVLLQGSNPSSSEAVSSESQSAVLTKISPAESQLAGPTHLVSVQPKTVPVSTNTVFTTTLPTKHGNEIVRIVKNKEQLSFVKSPTTKSLSVPTSGVATKKIVIASNLNQNVVLKTVSQKQTPVVVSGTQRTQLHPINMPGKGVQYIRLVTNPTNAVTKPLMATKNQSVINVQPKTIIVSDGKGNLIMSSSDKMNHPPPLVMTGCSVIGKVNSKPHQKLVRIAPVGAKTTQIGAVPTPRSAQSLLAPITTEEPHKILNSPQLESNGRDQLENSNMFQTIIHEATMEQNQAFNEVSIDETPHQDIEIEIQREQSPEIEEQSMSDHDNEVQEQQQPPVIIIKPEYLDRRSNEESVNIQEAVMSIDQEHLSRYSQYSEPPSPPIISETDLIVRPRKACNCTKSQCLKLYCDCFANGEFCNNCNCTNCHNNLENEELRQKAIRGCLERNPNAFRPKIGKAKNTVGPDTVRRHNKGCNCKRSGCLKNYCECYEAKIACTPICKCLGCRNVEESVERLRRRDVPAFERRIAPRPPAPNTTAQKQPCSFVTSEVIEAVCQCLIAAAMEGADGAGDAGATGDRTPFAASNGQCSASQPTAAGAVEGEAVRAVIEEFARCLQDIINAAQHTAPAATLTANEVNT